MNPPVRNHHRNADRRILRERLEASGVSDRVTSAVLEVPRDQFVPEQMSRYAWHDGSLPIGAGQTISQPSLVGRMIDLLRTEPEHKILDVGTGSGYQAAILSLLVSHVVTVERIPSLCESAMHRLESLGYKNVSVHLVGEELGWPESAPYDGIIVGAASPVVPTALVNQLRIGGRLIVPVGTRDEQRVISVLRTPDGSEEIDLEPVRFVPLIGEGAW